MLKRSKEKAKLDPVKMKDWQIAEAAEENLRTAKDLAAEYPGEKKRPVQTVLYSAGCLVLLSALIMTMVLRMVNIYRECKAELTLEVVAE